MNYHISFINLHSKKNTNDKVTLHISHKKSEHKEIIITRQNVYLKFRINVLKFYPAPE